MLHTRNVAKAHNYRVRFFHKTTAFTHTVYFFKIRRIGFRRIGNEPRGLESSVFSLISHT